MKPIFLALFLLATSMLGQTPSAPHSRQSWCLCTAKVRRTIAFAEGKLYSESWMDGSNSRELQRGLRPAEFRVTWNGQEVASTDGEWSLHSAHKQPNADGSWELDLMLTHGTLEVTKSYVVYPGSSIIREWATYKNTGPAAVDISDPHFLDIGTQLGDLGTIDLDWMTGGENRPGSWMLKTESPSAGRDRNFDSYDPFPGATNSRFGFKMGSATYAPWFALFDRAQQEGIVVGFDYFGRWASSFRPNADQSISMQLKVAGYHQSLAPGASVTTPKAFTGIFRNDLDNAGNEVLDWQYQYLWDYTRAGWFPAIRMAGWWSNGTPWKDPGNTWVGGNGDAASAFRKVFRLSDLMSEVGADVYHRDWGWWDRAGDWGGPDFRTMGEYLRKHDMGQLVYAFIYTVDKRSKVAQEHPDWLLSNTLDMSNPAVVRFLEGQLDEFANRFGPFEWRNDSTPTATRGTDDTSLLGQDQGFRIILKTFLDRHPGYAFQGVNDGGNNAGYDYARYASSISFSDGAVGILRNYWASLILPPDKSSDIADNWKPEQYDKALWRGLLTINFDMSGDTWSPSKLEGVRNLIDIYHYLEHVGLVGRWVHVYRPAVRGDDPTMYFERLSRDGNRGIIILKHVAAGPVVVWPKGLNPANKYLVSYQESDQGESRTGADLMKSGITLNHQAAGELIYLNVPFHPDSRLYRAKPTSPADVRKASASNMGYPGVEIRWGPAHDEQWISYYEVARDGAVIDKVAKGTYFFDHSAGADLGAQYAVRAVNGGGLASPFAEAAGSVAATRGIVLDDVSPTGLSYTGDWKHEVKLQPAYAGTLTSSSEKGAAVEFKFEGTGFTWFTRLCGECGEAEVNIDGQDVAGIDTYSADDIFGVGIYSKSFATAGEHQVKITVLGKHAGPRGAGTRVYLDGIRIAR
ncbi:hypothetical protein AB4Y89_10010 [Terriglobus sp. 2YAB30_2]|uniref:hypothetical protein n=3 Tax=unclassified Terriglobus TaxID=2628988 RepID=UPI003F991207